MRMPELLLFLRQFFEYLRSRADESRVIIETLSVTSTDLLCDNILNTNKPSIRLIRVVNDTLVKVMRTMITIMMSFDMSGAIRASL